MDERSLVLLDVPKILERVAESARSTAAKERVRSLRPMSDVAKCRLDLARAAEMIDAIESRLAPPFDGLTDVRESAKRAEFGVMLEVERLRAIRDFADLTGRSVEYRARLAKNYPKLTELLAPLQDLRHLSRSIDADIDERGNVRDSSSPELAAIRRKLSAIEARIQSEMSKMLRSADVRKALRYAQPTLVEGHHVFAVAVNFRHLVPGVIHRTSHTGETLFVEPARVSQIAAESAIVKNAEEREIRKALRRITSAVGQDARRIIGAFHTLIDLDVVHAKACWSRRIGASAPEIALDDSLRIVNGRHPSLVELALADKTNDASELAEARRSVVPITVRLGDEFDMLVVTGPNTGGKTVAVKTVGLISALAAAGLPTTADPGSKIPLFRNILVDVGDEQSIEQSLSTFSGHMTRIAAILADCDRRSLVLLDELGSGTDPSEGSALGRAVIEELRAHGCRAMITTHLGELKQAAFEIDRVENAAVEFDQESLRPTYRLIVGQFGKSCAIDIAKRLGLPERVIKSAETHFERKGRSGDDVETIQRLRREAELARQEALTAKAEADAAATEFEKKSAELKHEAELSAAVEQAKLMIRPGDEVRVKRFNKLGIVKRVDRGRKLAAVTVGAVEWELPLDELMPNFGLPGTGSSDVRRR